MNLKETVELLLAPGAEAAETGYRNVDAADAIAIVGNDRKIVALEEIVSKFRPNPIRKHATVSLQEVASFCQYWGLYRSEDSRIFADPNALKFAAILDYHGAAERPANWRVHTVSYTLTKTVEWTTWLANNGKRMNQSDFATFIEDNAVDVVEPKSAEMVDIAREFEATSSVKFASGVRLQGGQQRLTYIDETKATVGKSQIEVPERFALRLSAFVGMPPVDVMARLRYRIEQGALTMWYDLVRPHKVAEQAFADAMKIIGSECGTPVLIGGAA